jgi:CRP/FNR family transcriptional regulator, cyclic AMP receptor protein
VRLFAQDAKVEALKRAPLFEGLTKRELAQLARLSDDLEVPAGQILCREGEIGQEVFVIVDGEVTVTRRGKRAVTGHAGEFFGEISIVEHMPRTATVTARTPVRLFVLTGQSFRSVLQDYPGVQQKVLVALARRLAELAKDPTLV